MVIIITKRDQSFFKMLLKTQDLNVVHSTETTLHIKLTTSKFEKLYQRVIESGNNPYAAMAW